MSTESQFVPPERLESWTRVRKIRDGSMASVWLYSKRTLGMGMESAVKIMKIDHPETRKALENEARKLLDISGSDEHIVTLYEVQEFGEGGNIALFTEYVPGENTLKNVMGNHPGPLPEGAAGEILWGVLKGMAHAHRHGIMHHDLWPSNVMIRPPKGSDALDFGRLEHGDVRIIDFGIARSLEDESTFTAKDRLHLYVAPELFMSGARGLFNDVYCIGLILYEMLNGRGSKEERDRYRRERDDPSTTERFFRGIYERSLLYCNGGAAPKAFREVLLRSLAYSVKDRYKDASEMLAAFERATRPEAVAADDRAHEAASPAAGPGGVWDNQAPPSETECDVYAGGSIVSGVGIATVWKNGQPRWRRWRLTQGDRDADVRDIVLSGGEVYAGGCDGRAAVVWKNGLVHSRLTDGKLKARVNALCVLWNGDVYAGGYEMRVGSKKLYPLVWINGRPALRWSWNLISDYSGGEVLSLYASGQDVYAGGYSGKAAVVWKNGKVFFCLTDGERNARVQSLFISYGNLYAGGWENDRTGKCLATVWKNGRLLHRLTKGDREALVTSIFVYDGDVYAGGREDSAQGRMVATVWKNGGVLYRLSDGGTDARVFTLFVFGGDVYAGGAEYDARGCSRGVVWKNGRAVWRTSGGSNAVVNAIFVRHPDPPEVPGTFGGGGTVAQSGGTEAQGAMGPDIKTITAQTPETVSEATKPRVSWLRRLWSRWF
jgi:tRNA A-37 threonylcarbamoyl transferase component Bud32